MKVILLIMLRYLAIIYAAYDLYTTESVGNTFIVAVVLAFLLSLLLEAEEEPENIVRAKLRQINKEIKKMERYGKSDDFLEFVWMPEIRIHACSLEIVKNLHYLSDSKQKEVGEELKRLIREARKIKEEIKWV